MALHQLLLQTESSQQSTSPLLLEEDDLYCEEETWEEEVEEQSEIHTCCVFPIQLLDHDLFWEDEELLSLFSKEQNQQILKNQLNDDPALFLARREAVQWMLKVISYYGFLPLTSILAINYLDRFLSSPHFQIETPWMIQLVAVTCLSLAAKVEETHAPLLLDLQVEQTKYVFEAKTVQRMELLILSTLQWKMNPVTPISFLDHIIRRLGMKTNVHWDFFKHCEHLLFTIISDSRFVRYLPSVLATATMLHVINQVETCNTIEYQSQLLNVLKNNKEDLNECYELIFEVSTAIDNREEMVNRKRKYDEIVKNGSFWYDSSNDSWINGSSLSSSVSSTPEIVFKKSRVQKQQQMMRLC